MIEVLQRGFFTSYQDLGRFGFRKYGVPVSGAMDQYAALLANQILGNHLNAALLEFALTGPSLHFKQPVLICLSGADFNAQVNDKAVSNHKPIRIQAGDVLKIGSAKKGVYGYLAIESGFKADFVLGSHSYYKGICDTNLLKKGDWLWANKVNHDPKSTLNFAKISPFKHTNSNLLDVFTGPEFGQLSTDAQAILFSSPLKLSSEINRMGYRIAMDKPISASEIITAPVQPGTVQLTPGGKLIALMRDAQTTGGYARILQLSNEAIALLAQKRPNDCFQFKLISKN